LWALAGTFLLWLGLEHLHGMAASRLMRLALAASRRLGMRVVREQPGRPASAQQPHLAD
jgi:hypothetical protein